MIDPQSSQTGATMSVHQRALSYRRDFRLIYATALTCSLVAMPFRRLATLGQRYRGRRPSMWVQARADANIVASYALMGF